MVVPEGVVDSAFKCKKSLDQPQDIQHTTLQTSDFPFPVHGWPNGPKVLSASVSENARIDPDCSGYGGQVQVRAFGYFNIVAGDTKPMLGSTTNPLRYLVHGSPSCI